MTNGKKKLNALDQQIHQKLTDSLWDADIACRVLQIRKDRHKKWIQITILPVLLLGTTTMVFYTNLYPKKHHDITSEESILNNDKNPGIFHVNQEYQDFFNKKFNYNEHLMNTVFNQSP